MMGCKGCREARLRTGTDRLAAIALYLQLDFEPLASSDSEREAWEEVISFLRSRSVRGRPHGLSLM